MATTYSQIIYPATPVDKLTGDEAKQAHSAIAELAVLHPQAIHMAEVRKNGTIKLTSVVKKGRA